MRGLTNASTWIKKRAKQLQNNLSILVIIIICASAILLLHKISDDWHKAIQFYRPLNSHIETIRQQLATSHLWLEEGQRGNAQIDFARDVTRPLERLIPKYISFLEQNPNQLLFFFDQHISNQFFVSAKQLELLLNMFAERKIAFEKQIYERHVDTDFNKQFNQTNAQLNLLAEMINSHIDEHLEQSYQNNQLRLGIFSICCLLFLFIVILNRVKLSHSKQKINQERKRAFEVLTGMADAVISTDFAGKMTFLNATAAKLLQTEHNLLLGQPMSDFIQFDSQLNSQQTSFQDSVYIYSSKQRFPAQITLTQFNQNDTRGGSKVIVITDLSEQHHLTAMLIQQSRHAAMGEMVGNLAHQWRQPLNAISLLIQKIQLLYEHGKLNHEIMQKNINQAMQLISEMSLTIDKFRHFFSPKAEPELFSVAKVIEQVQQLVAPLLSRYQTELNIEKGNNISITTYRNELLQIILSLVKNSIESIAENKPELPIINIVIHKENSNILVYIKDNGCRIPQHILRRVFEPYFSTKKNNQGNGLYMVKTILEKHMSGKIFFVNKQNSCSVIIRLPEYTTQENKTLSRKTRAS